jgi:acid phosphatase type 7
MPLFSPLLARRSFTKGVLAAGVAAGVASAMPHEFSSSAASSSTEAAPSAVTAGCAPMQNFISFINTPDQMSVSWATSCSSSTVVKWGLSSSSLTNTVSNGIQTTYSFNGGAYTSPYLHHANLTGLPLATQIYYSVGGDASGMSPVYSFTSHPGYGLQRGGSVFSIVGDLGQTTNSQDTIDHVAAAKSTANTSFVAMVHAGDLSYADSYEPRWDSWQEMVAPLAAGLPWMTIVGNHEIELDSNMQTFEAYKARFPMPWVNYGTSQQSKQIHYSFKCAGVHWLMLSSYTDFDASSVQYQWLQNELANNVDRSVTPWLVAMVHAPWYNSNTAHHGEGDAMRQVMESMLYNAGVDLVFAGHVHAYERFHRVYNNAVDTTGKAPYYITIGDGGNREGLASTWYTPQPAISAFRQASYGHGELKVVNATHMFWGWHQNPDLEPTIADSFWIVKGQSTELSASSSMPRFQAKKSALKGGKKGARKAMAEEVEEGGDGVTKYPVFRNVKQAEAMKAAFKEIIAQSKQE